MNQTPLVAMERMPGDIVPLRLPAPAQVFEKRSARFLELAQGHPLGDYLKALARLAEAQAVAGGEITFALGGRAFKPSVPLRATEWRRGEAWRRALGVIISAMENASLPNASLESLARLKTGTLEALESTADMILNVDYGRIDLAAAPFVGAALQVYWTALAAKIPAGDVERTPQGCPVCGSPPVAAAVLGDEKLRYLSCSLCAAQWHLTRVICSNCGSTDSLSYFTIAGESSGVKAEACAKCNTYLKLFYLEQAHGADPFADDAATIALDLLMSEAGYTRSGVNLFLLSRPDS